MQNPQIHCCGWEESAICDLNRQGPNFYQNIQQQLFTQPHWQAFQNLADNHVNCFITAHRSNKIGCCCWNQKMKKDLEKHVKSLKTQYLARILHKSQEYRNRWSYLAIKVIRNWYKTETPVFWDKSFSPLDMRGITQKLGKQNSTRRSGLKWSIFILWKQALHKNGVEFHQQFNGAGSEIYYSILF